MRTVGIALSDRLEAVAELVKRAADGFREVRADALEDGSTRPVIADIGTDHGYLAAALLDRGTAGRVIACDVNEGPLERAGETLEGYEGAQVRLCDGLKGLAPGEADIAVMAGMGGRLMMRIIEEGDPRRLGIRAMVLQPQSEIYEFRAFLRERGYRIVDERSVRDAGKFYQAMLAKTGDEAPQNIDDTGLQGVFDRYGQIGILRGDEALFEHIGQRIDRLREIMASVPEDNIERLADLRQELDDTKTALRVMSEKRRSAV